jgi:quinol monooxygenase YgiN
MFYGLSGKMTAIAGKRDELAEILLKAAEILRPDPECLLYVIGHGEEADSIYTYEAWTSKEAHDKALDPENVRALIAQAKPLISKMDQPLEYKILGGKGLPR